MVQHNQVLISILKTEFTSRIWRASAALSEGCVKFDHRLKKVAVRKGRDPSHGDKLQQKFI